MSSPARSTVSAASAGAISASDDVADSIDAFYRKDEAMAELNSEALQKEVRSLDDDRWMFAAPRSRINRVSMSVTAVSRYELVVDSGSKEFLFAPCLAHASQVVTYASSRKNWLTSVKHPRRRGISSNYVSSREASVPQFKSAEFPSGISLKGLTSNLFIHSCHCSM